MNILNHGILLTGVSGIGKSELALVLIRSGHQLVADDAVLLAAEQENTLIGTCPPIIQNLLEIRGLGIIDVRELFGEKAISPEKKLDLIIKLIQCNDEAIQKIDRIEGMYQEKKILDAYVTEVTLPVAPGRNLSVLVEVAIRNYILRNNGYSASDLLKQRQAEAMREKHVD